MAAQRKRRTSGSHKFTRNELEQILADCIDKTLGEVDKNHVFAGKAGNRGIAGAVIEQSVLGYPADSFQRPDLTVDGVDTELKTTGIIPAKKNTAYEYDAKEPVTVTAVSPERIVSESFADSAFWHKVANILFVYYLYAFKVQSTAEYANFPIKGFEFNQFSAEDIRALETDWTAVRDFIQDINDSFSDPTAEYPRISSELNHQLACLDTAPKWPKRPRFRLKRAFVSTIVQEYFGEKFERLPESYDGYSAIDRRCHQLNARYSGKTLNELIDTFDIPVTNRQKVNKGIAEQLVVRMFDGTAKTMNKVEVFSKFGITAKSVVFTEKGLKTEDTKLFPLDFDELCNPQIEFEDSTFRSNFASQQILFAEFTEPSNANYFVENIFVGFKRFWFTEEFIDDHVQNTWNRIRNLIFNHELKDVISYNRQGLPIINKKTKTIRSAPNFPKSSNSLIFVRGTGTDSTVKPITINDVHMYRQNLWIKGTYLAKQLASIKCL
ncbi:restriction endonuclease [Bifidobacterium primatium]|uniref:Restriction endonuclease n=1 Tax=Bifidobacterium primatium TaxID=2045438 RepID=A0A2M9HBD8_9BIFI|nr:MutH/Sau3AI family endonuclease [Bifidobacterium primatium]PJM74119.1 restriction endonuclease [Bifidobacterium primatium]